MMLDLEAALCMQSWRQDCMHNAVSALHSLTQQLVCLATACAIWNAFQHSTLLCSAKAASEPPSPPDDLRTHIAQLHIERSCTMCT